MSCNCIKKKIKPDAFIGLINIDLHINLPEKFPHQLPMFIKMLQLAHESSWKCRNVLNAIVLLITVVILYLLEVDIP